MEVVFFIMAAMAFAFFYYLLSQKPSRGSHSIRTSAGSGHG